MWQTRHCGQSLAVGSQTGIKGPRTCPVQPLGLLVILLLLSAQSLPTLTLQGKFQTHLQKTSDCGTEELWPRTPKTMFWGSGTVSLRFRFPTGSRKSQRKNKFQGSYPRGDKLLSGYPEKTTREDHPDHFLGGGG